METVKLSVNVEGLLKNLKFAFSSKKNVISELIGNGRRSGATQIDILFDEKSKQLTVQDNGCGIADFSVLLAKGTSGWPKDIVEEENPFGLGWLAALFNADAILVSSNGKKIETTTKAIVSFDDIQVIDDCEVVNGTKVVMTGFDIKEATVSAACHRFAHGFPVAISYNGELLSRNSAIDQLPNVISCDIGQVYIPGLEEGDYSSTLEIYLQGICVNDTQAYPNSQVVVHLDSKKFAARMPDRDCLVDKEEAFKKIETAVNAVWHQYIDEQKKVLPAKDFVEKFWDAAFRSGCFEIMNDVPIIPQSVLFEFDQIPYIRSDYDNEYLVDYEASVTKEQIEQKKIVLFKNIEDNEQPDDSNYAGYIFGYLKGWLILDGKLPKGHWANEYLREWEGFSYSANNVQKKVPFEGLTIAEVVFCKNITLTYEGESIVVDDQILPVDDNGFKLYIPANVNNTQDILRCLNSYTDEWDSFLEEDYDLDDDRLYNIIQMVRGEKPAETLKKCIDKAEIKFFESLIGKSFTLSVRKGAYVPEIDVKESLESDELVKQLINVLKPHLEKQAVLETVEAEIRQLINF